MTDTPKSLVGTRTEQNLVDAYIGESMAFTRYTFYAKAALKEKYYQVAEVFNKTAADELRHAKTFLSYLTEQPVVSRPVTVHPGIYTPLFDTLGLSARLEKKEGREKYLEYAKIAEEEGFSEIARCFRYIAQIERYHEGRFLSMQVRIEDGVMWYRKEIIDWECMECGLIIDGPRPPETCPACHHSYHHFKPHGE